jgi:hypothetical protein
MRGDDPLRDRRVALRAAGPGVDEVAPFVPPARGGVADGVVIDVGLGVPDAGGAAWSALRLFQKHAPCGGVAFAGMRHALANAAFESCLGGHVDRPFVAHDGTVAPTLTTHAAGTRVDVDHAEDTRSPLPSDVGGVGTERRWGAAGRLRAM